MLTLHVPLVAVGSEDRRIVRFEQDKGDHWQSIPYSILWVQDCHDFTMRQRLHYAATTSRSYIAYYLRSRQLGDHISRHNIHGGISRQLGYQLCTICFLTYFSCPVPIYHLVLVFLLLHRDRYVRSPSFRCPPTTYVGALQLLGWRSSLLFVAFLSCLLRSDPGYPGCCSSPVLFFFFRLYLPLLYKCRSPSEAKE